MRTLRASERETSRDAELNLVVEVARLAADLVPQKDIAGVLGLSTSTVSRLVGRAKDEQILRTTVMPPPLTGLAEVLTGLLESHNVRHVLVVPDGPDRNTANLASAGAAVALDTIRRLSALKPPGSKIRIVLSCGTTIMAVIEELAKLLYTYCEVQKNVVPREICIYPSTLVGAFELDAVYPHTAVTIFANEVRRISRDRLKVTAFAPQLPQRFYERHGDNEIARREALEEYGLNTVVEEAKKADIIIMGAGTASDASYQRVRSMLKVAKSIESPYQTLELLYTPLDADGVPEPETERRIIGVTVTECLSIKDDPNREIIMIAGGEEKYIPLQTAFINAPFTTLVTDRGVALETESRAIAAGLIEADPEIRAQAAIRRTRESYPSLPPRDQP